MFRLCYNQTKPLSWHVLAAGWNAEKALDNFNSKWQSASQIFLISVSVRIDWNSEGGK